MKHKITNIISIAFLVILLFGLNNANAQVQKSNVHEAYFNPLHIYKQPTITNNNTTTSLGKKITKQRLDNIVTEIYDVNNGNIMMKYKTQFTYDFNGRIITSAILNWNDTFGNYQKESFSTYGYNTQGYRILSEDYYAWNNTTNLCENALKNEYTFDNKGNQTSNISYNWDASTQTFLVDNKSKTSHVLNIVGKPTISYDSIWNSSTNTYNIGYKTEYTYNSGGMVLVKLRSRFSNNNWVNNYKYDFIYDASGNKTSSKNYQWNAQTNEWEGTGNCYTNVYDVNNNQTLKISANWNSTTIIWDNQNKTEFSYDNMGNLNIYSNFNWDKSTNKWVNANKGLYNYNNTYLNDDIVWDVTNGLFKHMVTDGANQELVNNTWVNRSKFNAYYSASNYNGLNETSLTTSNIYPNPTTGNVNISSSPIIESIHVFDISGKLVLSLAHVNKQTNLQLDLSSLNNGIYFIHVQTDNGNISKNKVVVSK